MMMTLTESGYFGKYGITPTFEALWTGHSDVKTWPLEPIAAGFQDEWGDES